MKQLLRKALLLIATIMFGSTGNFLAAQQNNFCGTDERMAELLKNDPEVKKAQEELEQFTREYISNHKPEISERGSPLYIIPVVFHIIHDNGPENISTNNVNAVVNVLNQDFQRLNADTSQVIPQFKHLIADCDIEFRLAQKDPDGNCTNGIDRVFSYRTYQGDDRAKVVIWDRKNYLNIWVVNKLTDPGTLAYAYLPSGAAGLGYRFDGVITRYGEVGAGKRTLTHEIGHSLNLSHPWGGGQVGQACGDDGVTDTPVTEGRLTNPNCPGNKIDFTCDRDTIKMTYQFDEVTTTSGQSEPNPMYVINPASPDTALTLMNFSASDSLSANSTIDSAFAFTGWGTGGIDGDSVIGNHTGSIDLTRYYEFTVRPQLGQGMTMTGIRFTVKRNATGPRMFAARSSETVNFGSNLAATILSPDPNVSAASGVFYINYDNTVVLHNCRFTLSGAPYTDIDDTVTFRIYAWNAEDASTGTFEIDSVAILGTFGTIENYDNYMDYTGCDNMFTPGQAERMHAALNSPVAARNNLTTPENHALTGIDNPQLCAPEADFYVNKTMACVNGANSSTVQFFDNSQRGTVTSRTWTFPNGTPATSTAQNPTVTFSDLWNQSVTLSVSNSAGSSSVTKNMVWVAPLWADYTGLFYEDFEDPSHFNTMWRVDNRSGNASSWQVANSGTFPSGTHGLKLNAFSPVVLSTNTTPIVVLDWGIGGYDKDAFITPAFDLSHVAAGTGKLEFKLSGATRASNLGDVNDELRVRYSINCGNTWVDFPSSAGVFVNSNLNNAGSWQSAYAPTTLTQWTQKTLTIPTVALNTNVRFRFEYTSGDLSNNIYIDDFNISGTVGIEDNAGSISADMVLYPNPAGSDVSVTYRLSASRSVKLQVYDALGNLVYDLVNQKQAAGSYAISFSTSQISNGIYYVTLSGDNVSLKTDKLVIIK